MTLPGGGGGTGPPNARPPSVSAQIREQQSAALKFRSEQIDVLENNRRIEVITQSEARRRIAIGGYEAVGNNTVKYIRRLPPLGGPVDGPPRKVPPRASDNYTVTGIRQHQFGPRFEVHGHPWHDAPMAGCPLKRKNGNSGEGI